jgi:hypothetical protein
MLTLSPQQLLLGGVHYIEQLSLNAAAWQKLAQRGAVSVAPLTSEESPAVIVSITPEGKAAAGGD